MNKIKIKINLLIIIPLIFSGELMAQKLLANTASFENNGMIDEKYSCKGITPQFSLKEIPEGTKSLILIIDDPDAQPVVGHTFVHFIGQFKSDIKMIPEGKLDSIAVKKIKNDAGNLTYYGPCPPKGPAHKYYFTWLALNKDADITKYSVHDFRDTWDRSSKFYKLEKDNIIGFTQLMGKFQKK